MAAFGNPTKGGTRPDGESSMSQNTAVNPGMPAADKGNRPGAAKVMIETSAPSDPHTLGRAPSGWLR